MSTPSKIILKLRKEDIGKKVKFDASKLPAYLEEWGRESGESLCEEVALTGPYIGIYCHWDGYFEGVGSVLSEIFNDYSAALNLIIGGFCSSIGSDSIRHYANRQAALVGGWKGIKPIQGSLNEVENSIYGQYEYVFDMDKWESKES